MAIHGLEYLEFPLKVRALKGSIRITIRVIIGAFRGLTIGFIVGLFFRFYYWACRVYRVPFEGIYKDYYKGCTIRVAIGAFRGLGFRVKGFRV